MFLFLIWWKTCYTQVLMLLYLVNCYSGISFDFWLVFTKSHHERLDKENKQWRWHLSDTIFRSFEITGIWRQVMTTLNTFKPFKNLGVAAFTLCSFSNLKFLCFQFDQFYCNMLQHKEQEQLSISLPGKGKRLF